jgi:hypothetical protein
MLVRQKNILQENNSSVGIKDKKPQTVWFRGVLMGNAESDHLQLVTDNKFFTIVHYVLVKRPLTLGVLTVLTFPPVDSMALIQVIRAASMLASISFSTNPPGCGSVGI